MGEIIVPSMVTVNIIAKVELIDTKTGRTDDVRYVGVEGNRCDIEQLFERLIQQQ